MHKFIAYIGFAVAVTFAWPVAAQTGAVLVGSAPGQGGRCKDGQGHGDDHRN